MQSKDRELIEAFQAGRQEAFDTLYRQYAGRVLAFAHQITGSQSDAEDLTQETFLAAYKGLSGFQGQANLLTWLFSILIRRRRDQQRRSQLHTVSYMDGDEHRSDETAATTYGGNPEGGLTAIALSQALETLEPALREAFALVAIHGLTHKEAAAVLEQPLGTVKWRVAQAAQRLRKIMHEDETNAEGAKDRAASDTNGKVRHVNTLYS